MVPVSVKVPAVPDPEVTTRGEIICMAPATVKVLVIVRSLEEIVVDAPDMIFKLLIDNEPPVIFNALDAPFINRVLEPETTELDRRTSPVEEALDPSVMEFAKSRLEKGAMAVKVLDDPNMIKVEDAVGSVNIPPVKSALPDTLHTAAFWFTISFPAPLPA